MRNKAYHFTVEDNGIYYKDRNLVHKRNSSFEFGELVSSMKRLVSSKRRGPIPTWWWAGLFPYTEHQEEGEETVWFSEELMFIYQTCIIVSCCLLIPKDIKHVVHKQDIWMEKVLSVPRQVTESIVYEFICLYLGSNTSLMDEVGRIGGWWSFLGQVLQKLEQKWITVFKGTDSLDTSIWALRSFATSCSLLVKIIQTIEKIHVVKRLLDEK